MGHMRPRYRSGSPEHYRSPWNGFLSRLGRQRISAHHWVGLLIIVVALSVGLFGVALDRWPSGPELWWRKAVTAYGWYLALVLAVWVVIIAGNKIARHRRHRRP